MTRPRTEARAAFALWGLLGTLGIPLIRFALRRRVRAGKEIAERLGERTGRDDTPRPPGRLVWLHAASVGETLSLLPLIEALRERDPALALLLTTGTATSQALAEERLADSPVVVRFAPLDVPSWVNRFLDHWRPDLLILVESEIWPTLIARCRARAIPLALVNGRLSDRSFKRWARSGAIGRALFGAFALISARSPEDAARLGALTEARIAEHGDLKRAAAPLPCDAAELARLRDAIGHRPLWLAASTHPNEEQEALALHAALRERHPDALLVIAPRHPQRGDEIAALSPGLPRRSEGAVPRPDDAVWLCDTLGELGLLYRLCPVVVLGNSFAAVAGRGGGHNPLEPARLGCALGAGPHMQNFAEDVRTLSEAGVLRILPDRAAMLDWLDRMLSDPDRRQAASDASRRLSQSDADLPRRLARHLLVLIPEPER
ncbi:3-deoxy-D-manno-octulosonic acid transferase [Acetobacteraceae bacterium KSS8]|uniref:3-deoxy-D-manno-octulosonic acid transferase n=1 Tax=Endosaccharibacter trunci TaxID=2812733 RepID=A0ABT1W6H1_9PROT|nr:3-deoxy-D-manno-octulosonic acid transferase [Acetobacteraceae bacterium KSS8]